MATPITSTPLHPWRTIGLRQHSRLFVDATRQARLQQRWTRTDPKWTSIVKLYQGKTDRLRLALTYLATGNAAAAHRAAAAVPAYSLYGAQNVCYGDVSALVLDWCYPVLTAAEKTTLITAVLRATAQRETAIGAGFQWHESHYKGFHAYLMGALAVEGEAGAPSRLTAIENAINNYTALGNESHGDGTYKTYSYQDLYFYVPRLLWTQATGQNAFAFNRFLQNHAEFLFRQLRYDRTGYLAQPRDQAADVNGLDEASQKPRAMGPAIYADIQRDGFAQYVGQIIQQAQGWSDTTNDAQWLALMFYDDTLAADRTPPQPVHYYPTGGIVNLRRDWSRTAVRGWFYAGPLTEHAEPDAGHIAISRGRDDLLVSGSNYFGTPRTYQSRWHRKRFARNTLCMSPTGSRTPDARGSQTGAAPQPIRNQTFPLAAAFEWSGAIMIAGTIVQYSDDGTTVVVVADCTKAYNATQVQSYIRTVAYHRPNIFVIRDRWSVRGVGQIRRLWHMRQQPRVRGSTITVDRGISTALLQVLTVGATIKVVGGAAHGETIDGVLIDPRTTAQSWLLPNRWQLQSRLPRVAQQYRCEVRAPAGRTELLHVITVGATGIVPTSVRVARTETIQMSGIRIPLPN